MAFALFVVSNSLSQLGVPSPPPPNLCIWSPPGHPEVTYDLTAFEPYGDVDIPSAAGDNAQFYVQACGMPTRRCTQSECPDCDVTDPAGVNTWSAPGQDSCAAIGAFSTAVWSLQNPSDPAGGAQISYTGGDQAQSSSGQTVRRSATVIFKCGGSNGPTGVSAAEVPIHSLHYSIVLSGAAACAITPQPLSWGWWTIIFFGLSSLGYFGGGSYYNARVKGEEGLNAIPQWAYWQTLPGLVKDGSVFFYKESRLFSRNGRQYVREWYQGIGSKEVSMRQQFRAQQLQPARQNCSCTPGWPRARPHASAANNRVCSDLDVQLREPIASVPDS